mmetsp:Transcript_5308/g.9436  ORF Transcript_5308/g.9436 Transcript_5308/m.9436 type:complete len:91 (+) Transcript_5308:424-696(+)
MSDDDSEEEYFDTSDGECSYETASDSEDEEEVQVEIKKEKADQPCKNYKVDTTAGKFGQCECGWKKSDHLEKKREQRVQGIEGFESKRGD